MRKIPFLFVMMLGVGMAAPAGQLSPESLKGWTRVSWVAGDSHGLIYLLQRDLTKDPVVVLNRQGRVVRSWGKGLFTIPHAIRIDPHGNVWTTDAATSVVREFSPEGKALLKIEVGGLPTSPKRFRGTTDIAFAPDGHLFIADGYLNARIIEFTADGRRLREWGSPGKGPGQFRVPHSIQIDESGMIYVADRENGRVERFDLNGKYLGEWSFGKTFALQLSGSALWLSAYPLGGNDDWGRLLEVDRRSGAILESIETNSGHGIGITAEGDVLAAAPDPNQSPLIYRNLQRR